MDLQKRAKADLSTQKRSDAEAGPSTSVQLHLIRLFIIMVRFKKRRKSATMINLFKQSSHLTVNEFLP